MTVWSEATTIETVVDPPQIRVGFDVVRPCSNLSAWARNAVAPAAEAHVVLRTTAQAPFGPSYSPTRSPAQAETADAAVPAALLESWPSSQIRSCSSPSVSCMVSFQPLIVAGTAGTDTATGFTFLVYRSGWRICAVESGGLA